MGEDFYRDAIEHCRSYNARLCAERSTRLPFLDAQTGVAQSDCYIWMERSHRGPGLSPGQIYSYPARCWRKKRRLNILEDPRLRPLCDAPQKKELGSAVAEGAVLEALLCAEPPKEPKEEEALLDCQKPPPGDFAHDAEGDEMEDDAPRRKNKAKGKTYGLGAVRKRQDAAALEDRDKPYVCDICGKRYKNRPGLSYHYTHTHLAEEEGEESAERHPLPFQRRNHHKQFYKELNWVPESQRRHAAAAGRRSEGPCDFCVGGAVRRAALGHEEMIACADCGRAGHPSCLQFTLAMAAAARSYRWQCIECKNCSLCGSAENDEQLLFCDDCDRGYHMYCISPPVAEPPEGTWSCHLCLRQLKDKAAAFITLT